MTKLITYNVVGNGKEGTKVFAVCTSPDIAEHAIAILSASSSYKSYDFTISKKEDELDTVIIDGKKIELE